MLFTTAITTGIIITTAIFLVRLMISTSRSCLPWLTSNKVQMTDNLEKVSQTFLDGQTGIKQYMLYLRRPFSKTSAPIFIAPDVESTSTQGIFAHFTHRSVFIKLRTSKSKTMFTIIRSCDDTIKEEKRNSGQLRTMASGQMTVKLIFCLGCRMLLAYDAVSLSGTVSVCPLPSRINGIMTFQVMA